MVDVATFYKNPPPHLRRDTRSGRIHRQNVVVSLVGLNDKRQRRTCLPYTSIQRNLVWSHPTVMIAMAMVHKYIPETILHTPEYSLRVTMTG